MANESEIFVSVAENQGWDSKYISCYRSVRNGMMVAQIINGWSRSIGTICVCMHHKTHAIQWPVGVNKRCQHSFRLHLSFLRNEYKFNDYVTQAQEWCVAMQCCFLCRLLLILLPQAFASVVGVHHRQLHMLIKIRKCVRNALFGRGYCIEQVLNFLLLFSVRLCRNNGRWGHRPRK